MHRFRAELFWTLMTAFGRLDRHDGHPERFRRGHGAQCALPELSWKRAGVDRYHDRYERNAEGCPNGYYDKLIYRTGYPSSGSCDVPPEADTQTFATLLRHMNWDYVNHAVKYCDDPGEPGCQGGDGAHVLPNSLYLPSKPTWYGTYTWPPFDPAGPVIGILPAKARFGVLHQDVTAPRPPRSLANR